MCLVLGEGCDLCRRSWSFLKSMTGRQVRIFFEWILCIHRKVHWCVAKGSAQFVSVVLIFFAWDMGEGYVAQPLDMLIQATAKATDQRHDTHKKHEESISMSNPWCTNVGSCSGSRWATGDELARTWNPGSLTVNGKPLAISCSYQKASVLQMVMFVMLVMHMGFYKWLLFGGHASWYICCYVCAR